MKKERSHAVIYERLNEDEVIEIGYGAALSSFDSLRGVDMSDITIGIFDEFIEKKTLQFDQFRAYDDFYETVNEYLVKVYYHRPGSRYDRLVGVSVIFSGE